MATVKDTTCQGGEMERIYKDDGSSTGEQTKESGTYEIQDHKETQKYNNHKGVPRSQKDRC